MMILGLDCATVTGWALVDSDTKKVIESGVCDFSKKRGESNGIMFLRFRKWLSGYIDTICHPAIIAYERAHFRGGAATEICVGLQTRVQEIAAEFSIESMPVATTTLKKFATGNGRAGKAEMIKAAKSHIGKNPIDDNEADSIHVAMWAASEIY